MVWRDFQSKAQHFLHVGELEGPLLALLLILLDEQIQGAFNEHNLLGDRNGGEGGWVADPGSRVLGI